MKAIISTTLAARRLQYLLAAALCFPYATSALAYADLLAENEAAQPPKNLVYGISHLPDHTLLLQALTSADMIDRLRTKGPYSIFAPTNAAFAKLPEAMRQSMLKPGQKPALAQLLGCHVVPGKYDFASLAQQIRLHRGSVALITINGEVLRFEMDGSHNIIARDENGKTAHISKYDIYQSNGVINVIDTVLAVKD